MGFLSRVTSALGREKGVKVEAELLASGSLLSIVGESFYKPALASTAKLAVPGKPPTPVTGRALGVAKKETDLSWFQAILVREPENPYDVNAIAVYSPAGKTRIGISRSWRGSNPGARQPGRARRSCAEEKRASGASCSRSQAPRRALTR